MTPQELRNACTESVESTKSLGFDADLAGVALVLPAGFKRPPKFPRGELLLVMDNGDRVWSFSANRLLAWVASAMEAA